jgi:hypothetical protein
MAGAAGDLARKAQDDGGRQAECAAGDRVASNAGEGNLAKRGSLPPANNAKDHGFWSVQVWYSSEDFWLNLGGARSNS